MRIASFTRQSTPSWGVVEGDSIHDLGAVTGLPELGEALRTGRLDAALGAVSTAPVIDLAEVQLLPPVTDPRKILCVGLNYADHIAEMQREAPAKPTIFTRYPDTFVGDGESLIAPRNSARFDYEGEFAIVIGRGGRHVRAEDALDHVLGYTVMNDGSIRDYQRHTTQFTPGKNFPRSGSLGPWIVTAGEFGDVGTQRITTSVNSLVVQDSSLDQLVFGVPELIAYITEWTELAPGDVIATGTPGGVGDGHDPALYLFPGDVVRVEIDGVGSLTNPVAEEA
jgi:2-keto-4-pentenoate hydratase/2-oxohepta-3-ene-1,7-dioic acid hydratase in catechol pathway